MKRLLGGVVLLGMVFAVSSCMSDETFADVTQTYLAKVMEWGLAHMFDPEAREMSDAELEKVYEELLAEACKEHGVTVSAYKWKAKSLGKKIEKLDE